VEEVVDRLMKGVTIQENKLKICNIQKVGSYYEGTKICKPDEFDFLVQLEELSDSSKYVQTVNCYKNLGSVHVHATHDEYRNLKPTCEPLDYNFCTSQYVHLLFYKATKNTAQSLIESCKHLIEKRNVVE